MFLIGKRQIVTIFLSVLLFLNLFCDKKERVYLETAEKAANWLESVKIVTDQGLIFHHEPGGEELCYLGWCHGPPGTTRLYYKLWKTTGEQNYLDFSGKVTSHLLSKGTEDIYGKKWIQAEHRIRPELLIAQTGYMQGAAGIGLGLLRFDAFLQNKKPKIVLPDSPFFR